MQVRVLPGTLNHSCWRAFGVPFVPGSQDRVQYVLPAEWDWHVATWLSWPRPETISFPGLEARAQQIWLELVATIAPFEPVHVNVPEPALYRVVARRLAACGLDRCDRVQLHLIPSDEPWIRDHGPIFVRAAGAAPLRPVVLNWRYNAWGGKYPPWNADDLVPRRVAQLLGCSTVDVPAVLEGGAIDSNGRGVLLASRCLLAPSRNGHVGARDLESMFRQYLGATHTVWIDAVLAGDDTDGHVDQLVRFCGPDTVLYAQDHPRDEANAGLGAKLLAQLRAAQDTLGVRWRLVPLRLPAPLEREGVRLPASYLNFYYVNGAVIVPVFGCPEDAAACSVLQRLHPDRQVVPFDARELIWGLGAVHCATQQQPAIDSQCLALG